MANEQQEKERDSSSPDNVVRMFSELTSLNEKFEKTTSKKEVPYS